MSVVLHERGAERVLERLAVLDGDVLHRLHRVEVLRERHRQSGVAQFGDEAVEQFEHLAVSFSGRSLVDGELFGGLGDVALVLEQDVQRVLGGLLVDRRRS